MKIYATYQYTNCKNNYLFWVKEALKIYFGLRILMTFW